MIEAVKLKAEKISKAYDRRSGIYAKTVAQVEWPNHLKAIDHGLSSPRTKSSKWLWAPD